LTMHFDAKTTNYQFSESDTGVGKTAGCATENSDIKLQHNQKHYCKVKNTRHDNDRPKSAKLQSFEDMLNAFMSNQKNIYP